MTITASGSRSAGHALFRLWPAIVVTGENAQPSTALPAGAQQWDCFPTGRLAIRFDCVVDLGLRLQGKEDEEDEEDEDEDDDIEEENEEDEDDEDEEDDDDEDEDEEEWRVSCRVASAFESIVGEPAAPLTP